MRGLIGLAAVAAIGLSAPASAKVYNYTFTGTVTFAENFVFDDIPPATAHVGEAISGAFSFDSKNFDPSFSSGQLVYLDAISLLIPDQNFSTNFEGGIGDLFHDNGSSNAHVDGGRADTSDQLTTQFPLGTTIFTPSLLSGASGTFDFNSYGGQGFHISGNLTIDELPGATDPDPDFTPSIPEPMTWAMMIMGFGMIGGVMRRRSYTTTVRYA